MFRTAPRGLFAASCLLALGLPVLTHAQAVRRGGTTSGFTTNALPANDDGSTGLVNIGFATNFFGTTYNQLYVNNNGNTTFGTPLSTYTPFTLTAATGIPIIAAFFADVDTRGASALVRYGTGLVDGRAAFGVISDGVGYFAGHTDKLNIFEQILIDRSDTGVGNFDIEFDYDRVLWETGDASDGVNGFGGTPVAVGYSKGAGVAGTFAQLTGSLVSGALIDGGPNALVTHSQGSAVNGRYLFNVRNGQVVVPPPLVSSVPEPGTWALLGTGLLAVGGMARRRRRPAA